MTEVKALSWQAVRLTMEAEAKRRAANEGKHRCTNCADTGTVPAPEPYGSWGCKWPCPDCRQPDGVGKEPV